MVEALLEKEALTVSKSETLDPEDRESIEFELILIVDCENADPEKHKGHISINISTDDRLIFDKFVVGQKSDLKFLKQVEKQEFTVKAN